MRDGEGRGGDIWMGFVFVEGTSRAGGGGGSGERIVLGAPLEV